MSYAILESQFAAPFRWPPTAAVEMHFDDGYDTMYSNVYPLLLARGMLCSFNVISNLVGTGGRLTWAQCQEMSDAGFLICNHTDTHVCPFDTLNAAQKQAELEACATAIRANVETETVDHPGKRGDYYACYPCDALGNNADTVTAMTAAGMRLGTESGYVGNIPKTTPAFELDFFGCDLTYGMAEVSNVMNYVGKALYAGNVAGYGGHGVDTGDELALFTVFINWLQHHQIPVITQDDYYQRETA